MRKRPEARQLGGNALWWCVSIGVVILLWEALAAAHLINTIVLPPPHETLAESRNQAQFVSPSISSADTQNQVPAVRALAATLQRVFVGLVLAFSVSLGVGALAFYFGIFNKLALPTITLLSPIAPIAWLPLAIVLFGVGDGAAIFVVFIGLFFVLTLAVVN